MSSPYDALLLVSFGGPLGPDDVIPFLENVTRGRNVPRERLLQVAQHYEAMGGVSPIDAQTRALVAALGSELEKRNIALPIFYGNRNWHPFLERTVGEMRDRNVRHALAIATSAFGSHSGCRQYREDIARARTHVGENAPLIEKLRPFHSHPGFRIAQSEKLAEALTLHPEAHVIFTAHSIPCSMAASSPYRTQLTEACADVAGRAGLEQDSRWQLAWQSRSGPPSVPWLEPDVCAVIERRPRGSDVVVVPIGFLSDHMEVIWDLDHEARAVAEERGIGFTRVGTVGTHPTFVGALAELVEEALGLRSLNVLDPALCSPECCLPAKR